MGNKKFEDQERSGPQCTAHSKTTKNRCKRTAAPGYNVCPWHGGRSLRGVASPTFKHGRYSKYVSFLPERMHESFQRAIHDPELLSVRTHIALADARVEDLLQRVDIGECGANWRALGAAADKYEMCEIAAKNGSPRAALLMEEAKEELLDIVRKNKGDYATWAEVGVWIQSAKGLREAEIKRLTAMQAMVSVEQVQQVQQAILVILRNRIPDHSMLRDIAADFAKLNMFSPATGDRNAIDLPEEITANLLPFPAG